MEYLVKIALNKHEYTIRVKSNGKANAEAKAKQFLLENMKVISCKPQEPEIPQEIKDIFGL